MNIVFRQLGTGVEQIVRGCPFTELAEDQLYRDTGAPYHGLAQHDIGTDFDSAYPHDESLTDRGVVIPPP